MHSVDLKDKKSRKKNFTVGEYGTKKADRLTPNRFDIKPGCGGQGVSGSNKLKPHGFVTRSAKPNKAAEKETIVTLARVKSVALNLLNEVNANTETFEKELCSLEQFNEFLLGLLNYFSAFFDNLALGGKPRQVMTTELSQAELRAKAEIESRMATAQRKLAESYCVLVLGIGLPEIHHMACGEQRVSSTYKDREIYESLYIFSVHLVWIVFYRRKFELISKEVGRLLRSDVFNPALRVKHTPTEDSLASEHEKKEAFLGESNLTPAERRRQMEKRPAITSIINKRSPVIVSLLPTPKEKFGWLFGRIDPEGKIPGEGMERKQRASFKRNVGIIGEPLNLFNPTTLAPIWSDQDEDIADDTQFKKDTVFAGTPTNGQTKGPLLSRQITVQSQATDVFSDEED